MSNLENRPTGLARLLPFLSRARRAFSILVLSDDQRMGESIATVLASMASVVVAFSWEAAVAASEVRRPDILLYDFDQQEAAGWPILTQLHATPSLRHTLLLVLTLRASVNDKIAAFESGADDYLIKPITADQLRFHVQRLSHFRQVLGPN
jgi:PleD family two-component response regulator